MWLKAQNEMTGLWPHAAMGPVERMVRRQLAIVENEIHSCFGATVRLESVVLIPLGFP
jgi:hypothetical protein